jgi:hypothetical protein
MAVACADENPIAGKAADTGAYSIAPPSCAQSTRPVSNHPRDCCSFHVREAILEAVGQSAPTAIPTVAKVFSICSLNKPDKPPALKRLGLYFTFRVPSMRSCATCGAPSPESYQYHSRANDDRSKLLPEARFRPAARRAFPRASSIFSVRIFTLI